MDGEDAERKERTNESYPVQNAWPKLRQTEKVLEQRSYYCYIWAWYEITNPRDGDCIGAGITVIKEDDKGKHTITLSGEDGGSELSKVEVKGDGMGVELFEEYVLIFELEER